MNYFFYLFVFLFSCTHIFAQEQPSTEVRAVWLTTNWNLDWPSKNSSSNKQKEELCTILDQLQQANFNTVFFQVRVRGDVFYDSNIEPVSPFLNKNNYLEYDPLEYAIKECHKRGLQCHAWFVTFPLGTPNQVKRHGNKSIVKRQPNICKLHQGEWYLDPGNPQTSNYVLSLVDELVRKYNIDGIHFDYIRYPENAKKFPDNDTYKKYGNGQGKDEWRRNNINSLVERIYANVKQLKPWVQVSSSPLGRYKSLNSNKNTWTAYESTHQDAGKWISEGNMDAIYPMMYHRDRNFGEYLNEWKRLAKNRIIGAGLGIYQLLPSEGNWDSEEIVEQMDFIRSKKHDGVAFYRAENFLDNSKNIKNIITSNYFTYPAKVPSMSWIKNTAPKAPTNLRVYKNNDVIVIEWDQVGNEEQTFTLYQSLEKDIDQTSARKIIRTRLKGNKIYLKVDNQELGIYYAISATDRYNNESGLSHSAFFVISDYLQK